jgi:hypothetical protein
VREVAGGWRELHKERCHNCPVHGMLLASFYYGGWVGGAGHDGGCKTLVRRPERKQPFEDLGVN